MQSCHVERGGQPLAAAVFSAPGRHEQNAGRPAAAGTGANLALLGESLSRFGLHLLARRGEFTITNAWSRVEYAEATGRSEATEAEVLEPGNLDRLASEIGHVERCIFCFGDKAGLAVSALATAGRLKPGCRVVRVRHLSMRSLNQIRVDVDGEPIVAAAGNPAAGRLNTRRRIAVIAREILQNLFAHVRWIGGSPCSGKTAAAKLLAERHGLNAYHVDDHWDDHMARATPDHHPHLHRFRLDWDELFVRRPVEVQVESEFEHYREEWSLTLEDLLAFPTDRLLIAEGTSMLPELVSHLLTAPDQAIWIVPTEEFQKATYPTQRADFVNWVVGQTSNPDLALRNWMDRDAAYARLVADDARRRGFRVELVDGSRTIPEMAALVAEQFHVKTTLRT